MKIKKNETLVSLLLISLSTLSNAYLVKRRYIGCFKDSYSHDLTGPSFLNQILNILAFNTVYFAFVGITMENMVSRITVPLDALEIGDKYVVEGGEIAFILLVVRLF
ncbi:hypothetical protein BpHYR1_028518 [Brachionus plicatilis]|uniref:Uncharacterized protein n=1 Tax=Brachionus plicatilis TaxID=10195 RepID=A0A3M7RBE1_BRAPC|nr:hypothetical protein BpHYR1_028518 [Brachionus plicatilis]